METTSQAYTPAPAKVDQGAAEEAVALQVPFGQVALYVGLALLSYGFGSFFNFLPGQSVSAVLCIYGFPISLLGAAFQYAKLDPVPCTSYVKAAALRESKATAIQNQIRGDVTRYRYGDEQHLDEALKRVFRIGQGGGVSRRDVPKLTAIREEVCEGNYTLILCFDDNCPFEEFTSRQLKTEGFFGPGISAMFDKTEAGTEVYLISDGSQAGEYDENEWEILPPLAPGMPPRRVKKGSV